MITAVIMRAFEKFHVAKDVRPLELDHVCSSIYNGGVNLSASQFSHLWDGNSNLQLLGLVM